MEKPSWQNQPNQSSSQQRTLGPPAKLLDESPRRLTGYVLKRLLLVLPALRPVLTLVLLMIYIVPGAPAEQMPRATASHFGLGSPHSQYLHDVSPLVRGDFGQSFKCQALVRLIIFEGYPQLALPALLARRPTARSEGVQSE